MAGKKRGRDEIGTKKNLLSKEKKMEIKWKTFKREYK